MRFYEIFYTYTFGVDNFFGTKKAAMQYAWKRAKEDCPDYPGEISELIEEISPISLIERIKEIFELLTTK